MKYRLSEFEIDDDDCDVIGEKEGRKEGLSTIEARIANCSSNDCRDERSEERQSVGRGSRDELNVDDECCCCIVMVTGSPLETPNGMTIRVEVLHRPIPAYRIYKLAPSRQCGSGWI